MTAIVVTASVLDANQSLWHRLEQWQRDEANAWLRANGIDDRLTFSAEVGVMDCPFIKVTYYDENACPPQPCQHDDMACSTRTRQVALTVPLPDWWQPS